MKMVDLANHMKPAGFYNSGFRYEIPLSATPFELSFIQARLDGLPFVPTGVFSSALVDIRVRELDNFVFQAGPNGRNYPAPLNQTLFITPVGAETFTELIFVDYTIIRSRFNNSSGYY
jgi:hypothetical protein